MIPLAHRYSLAALALLAIAALPISLHHSRGAHPDTCSSVELQHLAAFGENHAVPEMGELEVSIHDLWVEGRLPPFAGRRPMFFRVVRSLDPYRFYGDVQRYLIHAPLPEDRHEVRALTAGSDVLPVHHQTDPTTGPLKLTQYFFAVDREPVTDPIRADLSLALDQLVRGMRPVMLFLVSGTANQENRPAFEEHANAWLAAVWSEYRRVCRS